MSTGDRRLDQFASLFRSAAKDTFRFEPPLVEDVCVVTDRPPDDAAAMIARVQAFLDGMDSGDTIRVRALDRTAWVDGQDRPVRALLDALEARRPDLVVTQRHLLGRDRTLAHTVGSVVDMLTQVAPAPVLLLPDHLTDLPARTDRVLVATDHLAGDDRLVNWGVHVTWRRGTLVLAHVEDDAVLEYFLAAIGRIRELDTDVARALVPRELLDRPRAYIETIERVLRERDIGETIVADIRLGHRLRDWLALVSDHDIDLVVLQSRDADQAAMHGRAHALAVELRHRPLLLI